MRKLIICDNEKPIVNSLADQLEELFPGEFIIFKYISDKQLLYDIEDETIVNPEILIMDISMKGGTDREGIDTAIRVRRKFPQVKIILFTGHLEQVRYIFQGIEPDGLLVKPTRPADITNAINKILQQLNTVVEENILQVKAQGAVCYIPYGEIFYIESRGRKLYIHTEDQVYEEYGKLNEFCEARKGYFLRCHQSYAVNIRHIRQVGKDNLILHNGEQVRISRGRAVEVQQELMQGLKIDQ